MDATFAAALIGFVGGSLAAAAISAFVEHCIFHPVISVCLDREKGSYGPVPFYTKPDEQGRKTHTHDGRYLRLRIENTGLSSIKDCCGVITQFTKRTATGTSSPQTEVIDLGWSHYDRSNMRNIPRGAYFFMDVVTLELFPPGRPTDRVLRLSTPWPTTMVNFFDDKATYEFNILIAADNAKPQRDLTVRFDYDPASDDLSFTPLDATDFPWWWRLRQKYFTAPSGTAG
jgi:hypothetical protein